MKCKAYLKHPHLDTGYLIDSKKLLKTENDLHARNSAAVEDFYRAAWFRDGVFEMSSFYLQDGIAYFINGRHRTILLTRHLDAIPMAFHKAKDECSEGVLRDLVVHELTGNEEFDLPDLEIIPIDENGDLEK